MKHISTKNLAPFLQAKIKQHGKKKVEDYLTSLLSVGDGCKGPVTVDCQANEYAACVDERWVCILDL